jgi:hypothetical protein
LVCYFFATFHSAAIAIVGIGISFDADLFFLSALAYRPSLAIQLNTYSNVNQQTPQIQRAARIAVGMVHVPHWRPHIPRKFKYYYEKNTFLSVHPHLSQCLHGQTTLSILSTFISPT